MVYCTTMMSTAASKGLTAGCEGGDGSDSDGAVASIFPGTAASQAAEDSDDELGAWVYKLIKNEPVQAQVPTGCAGMRGQQSAGGGGGEDNNPPASSAPKKESQSQVKSFDGQLGELKSYKEKRYCCDLTDYAQKYARGSGKSQTPPKSNIIKNNTNPHVDFMTWRSKICTWIFQAARAAKLSKETAIVAISYLDRFVCTDSPRAVKSRCNRKDYMLSALGCLYIAIKVMEPQVDVDADTMSLLSRGMHTGSDIQSCKDEIMSSYAKILISCAKVSQNNAFIYSYNIAGIGKGTITIPYTIITENEVYAGSCFTLIDIIQ